MGDYVSGTASPGGAREGSPHAGGYLAAGRGLATYYHRRPDTLSEAQLRPTCTICWRGAGWRRIASGGHPGLTLLLHPNPPWPSTTLSVTQTEQDPPQGAQPPGSCTVTGEYHDGA